MSTEGRYAIAVEQLEWPIPGQFDTVFRWEYEDARDELVRLYEKAKNLQWNTNTRIDWSQDLDPENPQELPDESVSIFGSEIWNRLTSREKANVRRHAQAWQLSQFLHGEQGALICTAKIVQQVPSIDAKFYAATQVMDEARHVETYSRLLHEEFAVEACYLMRDRFLSEEVWETLGLPVEECVGYVESSEMMRQFRSTLFSRIVPTIKDIGLWGPKIRRAYANMGIMGYAEVDSEELSRQDERVAQEFDARRASS